MKAEKKGYLTFDDIMDMADTYMLSVSEVDKLSEGIQLRGIIVYEDAPVSNNANDTDDTLEDYSRVDYDEIFREIVTIDPELEFIVGIIKELPPPQHGEVQSLAIQAVNGNEFAQERIILLHLRMAMKIALSTSKQYKFELADAVSSAFIGLIIGAKKYDPDGFSTFQSYASTWIYQSIFRHSTPTWMEYYFPVHYKNKLFNVLSMYEQFYGYLPDEPIHEEFISYAAETSDLSAQQIEECLSHILTQMFCKMPIDQASPEIDMNGDDESAALLSEKLMDNEIYGADGEFTNEPFDYVCEKAKADAIRKALEKLTERERGIMQFRYGITDGEMHTLEEVGLEFHLTRERIRQIEQKAIRKMRHPAVAKNLRDFFIKIG